MRQHIEQMVKDITRMVMADMSDMTSQKGWKTFNMMLEAHNDYQYTENNGIGYIYNIESNEDVVRCLNMGMTTKEVATLFDRSQVTHTTLFTYDCDNEVACQFYTYNEVIEELKKWIAAVLKDILLYPYYSQISKTIYTIYVTNVVIDQEESAARK